MNRKRLIQAIAFSLLGLGAVLVVTILGMILYFIVVGGIGAISWDFLTEFPRRGMTEGGIFPAIVGSAYLGIGTLLIALPLGISAAIYLSEFSHQGRLMRLIRTGINTLAGVPSIVFGLFGLALFVKYFRFGVSLLSGTLTLAFLVLPIVIRASEEALRAVPQEFREASLALGATKWQMIRTIVLPTGLPGILTGSILALGRAIGETAPIIFTAAAFYAPHLPRSLFDEVMALPYHLLVMATESTHYAATRHLQYGTALVLLGMVFSLNSIAILWRWRIRQRKRW